MIFSLSEISTVGASFEDDVKAYAAAGFDAIGVWEFKLPDDDDANLALLEAHGLRVSVCVPSVPSVLQLAIPGNGRATEPCRPNRCSSWLRHAARPLRTGVRRLPCGASWCAVDRGRHGDPVDGLRAIAGAAKAAAVRIGFEPVHVTQHESTGFVNSLHHADAVLAAADSPEEVGILFDAYHLWDDPAVLPWIAGNARRIVGRTSATGRRSTAPTGCFRRGHLANRRLVARSLRPAGAARWMSRSSRRRSSSGAFPWTRPPSRLYRGRRARLSAALDGAVELQDHGHVLLRIVEEAAIADGLRTLVIARQGKPAIAVELVQEPINTKTHAVRWS